MDLYQKVKNQKDIFEEKFMQAIKAKEEQNVRYELEKEQMIKSHKEEIENI